MFDATNHTTMNKSKEISMNNFRVEISISSGNVTNLKKLQSDDHMFVSWNNAFFANNKMKTSNTCLCCESSQFQHSLLPCIFAREFWHKLLTHRPQELTHNPTRSFSGLEGYRGRMHCDGTSKHAQCCHGTYRIAYHAITLRLGDLFKDRGIWVSAMHGRALLDRVMCSNPSWDRKLNPIHGLTLL